MNSLDVDSFIRNAFQRSCDKYFLKASILLFVKIITSAGLIKAREYSPYICRHDIPVL